MNKLIVLCGKSGSGKDAIMRVMLDRFCNLKPVVSDTTRPMREGEVDSREYNFITAEKFNELEKNGEYIEARKYNTVQNGDPSVWYYGINRNSIDLETYNYITIVDLEGLEVLKNKFGANVVSIYIDTEDEIRETRAMQRGGFDKTEWDRRLVDDAVKFSQYHVFNSVDYLVSNNDEIAKAVESVNSVLEMEFGVVVH